MKHVADLSCPVRHAPLIAERRQNVEIDECPQCRGVWLDGGELAHIVERATALALARASLGDYNEPAWDDTPPPVATPAIRAAETKYTKMFT